MLSELGRSWVLSVTIVIVIDTAPHVAAVIVDDRYRRLCRIVHHDISSPFTLRLAVGYIAIADTVVIDVNIPELGC
jgi:hypothetical protein